MQKVLFIVGPTGVGKTSLAFDIAQEFDFELISADSVQVYKGLDIISGKDIPKTSKFESLPQLRSNGFNAGFYTHHNIPIFLLDIVEPTSAFSVSQFEDLASKTIKFISEKDKIPVVVGGTGLYIKSIVDGLDTNFIEPNLELRAELDELTINALLDKLNGLNPQKLEGMNDSERNNKRRIIRAIEIIDTGIKNQELRIKKEHENVNLMIGLVAPREVLKKRIDARVEERLKNGALEEAELLFNNYDYLVSQVKDANGYKQLFSYLKKEISFDEAIYRWKISEYHHAKNQMTWFRKYGNVEWFDITEKEYGKKIDSRIKSFLAIT